MLLELRVEDLAEEKAIVTRTDCEDWLPYLEDLAVTFDEAGLSQKKFNQFVEAIPDLDILYLITPLITSDSDWKCTYQNLAYYVDESNFGLRGWLRSLACMERYKQERKMESKLSIMLGYLHCCTLATEGKEYFAFPDIVDWMLEQWGFIGDQPCDEV